jgi:uncharacterized protein (TIGR00255 family)
MKSMTGYGTSRASSSQAILEISVRCVNGRFLEPRFHLPKEYFSLEPELKKRLQNSVKRGTVDVFVQRRAAPEAAAQSVYLNRPLAKRYTEVLTELAKITKSPSQFRVETIAHWPDVISRDMGHEIKDSEKKAVYKAFESALAACHRERLREGQMLKRELEKTLKLLEKTVLHIQSLRSSADQDLQSKFELRLRSRLKGIEIDQQRLSQEVLIQLEKSDVNEEIVRLLEHIRNVQKLLSSADSEGKKLDFYIQELHREMNTIGSKSQISTITQSVVEGKTIIERLREQVQNIE